MKKAILCIVSIFLSFCSFGQDNQCPIITSHHLTSMGAVVTFPVQATDPDDDDISFGIGQQPKHGSAFEDGVLGYYTPDPGFTGNDTFTYYASDGLCEVDATVFVTVEECTDAADWQTNEIITYNVNGWGNGTGPGGILVGGTFIYPGGFTVGSDYTITFMLVGQLINFLGSQTAAPGYLTEDHVNPDETNAGTFASEVLALQLNVDYSDEGLIDDNSEIAFGDLYICGTDVENLDGMTIRQFLENANLILGGSTTALFSLSATNGIAIVLNNAFVNGVPSQFALEHLSACPCVPPPCENITVWQQGDIVTYDQSSYGAINNPAFTLLANNYSNVYVSGLTVGGTYTISFTMVTSLITFLSTQAGGANVLNFSLINPDDSPAGVFAAEVLALQLNVDFSDSSLLPGTSQTLFGDLYICGTGEPGLDGLTVRQFLEIANLILGATPNQLFGPGTASAITSLLNGAFSGGTPSQFALDHLSVCPCVPPPCETDWQTNEIFSYDQNAWSNPASSAYTWLVDNYQNTYPAGLIVGGTHQLIFTGILSNLITFLGTETGSVGVLNQSAMDPDNTSAGTFASDVISLQLNVDFSDASVLPGSSQTLFGDLYICSTPLEALNGLTVRQFLDTINHVLGGGNYSSSFAPAEAAALAGLLNTAFSNGVPSQFALDHLTVCPCVPPPCENITVWQQSDMLTYTQSGWDFNPTLGTHFDDMYPLGLVVGDDLVIRFLAEADVWEYLPAAGTNDVLDANHMNPSEGETASGAFGGQVTALQLNVDFSDSGILNSIVPLGDLYIHDFTLVPAVNGMTVRQFLDLANNILGGNNSAIIDADLASTVANAINTAFINGIPSQFALNSLKFVCPEVCENITEWQQSEITTYPQSDWGELSTTAGTTLNSNFFNQYGQSFVAGDNFTITFSDASDVIAFLPSVGAAGVLTFDMIDPLSSTAGILAGEVIALQLNVDFSDANLIPGSTPLGDLRFYGFPPYLESNGQSVREFLAQANYILGGGTGAAYGATTAAAIASSINSAFINGTPSQFAQDNLMFVCPEVCPDTSAWEANEIVIYDENGWGSGNGPASMLVSNTFSFFYANGLTIGGDNTITFMMVSQLITFVGTQTEAPGALDDEYFNPDVTSAGTFASEVLSLQLNVDYSDAQLIDDSSPIAFGNLYICGTGEEMLDGLTIRQFLDTANVILGAGASLFSLPLANAIVIQLNLSFLNGTPSQFAQDFLSVCPCTDCDRLNCDDGIACTTDGCDNGTCTHDSSACAVNCVLGDWSDWSACNATCGGGQQSRTRPVLVYPANGGAACADTIEYRPCNTQACPVNCVVGAWSDWSACNATCGGGTQCRTRVVITPAQNGGVACPPLQECRSCNTQSCPPPCANAVISFTLINSSTDDSIRQLNSRDTIKLSCTPNINIRANVCNPVESVRFKVNTTNNFRTESDPPYALVGDAPPGDYYKWNVTPGLYTIIATPYSGNNATGTPGTPDTTVIRVLGTTVPCAPQCTASTQCNDNSVCTADACVNGVCVFTPVNINDNDACTNDACHPVNGVSHTPVVCNDNNPCTTDQCFPHTGCKYTPKNCNDNNKCTVDECNTSSGACVNTYTCDDNNPCTIDGCNPSVGCSHNPGSGCCNLNTDCDDNNVCTIDACNNGSCSNTTVGIRVITSFTLFNSSTDQPIGPIDNGSVINLNVYPNVNIRANLCTNNGTGSVRFKLNSNNNFRTENDAPFALAGDASGNYNKWNVTPGPYVITATPYQNANAGGTVGTPKTINITVIGGSSKTSMDEEQKQIPSLQEMESVSLAAYPNPFSDKVTIEFQTPETMRVKVEIISLEGKIISVLYEGIANSDIVYTKEFQPGTSAQSMYFYRMITERGEVINKKLLMVK